MKLSEGQLRRIIREAIDENRSDRLKQQLKRYSAIALISAAAYFLGSAKKPMVSGDHKAAKEEVFLDALKLVGEEEALEVCKVLGKSPNAELRDVCGDVEEFLKQQ